MAEVFQGVRCINKEATRQAKAQIIESLKLWAKGFGLDENQSKELIHHVCSNAIQYSYSIGEDTEVSSLDALQEDLLERVSSENHHILPVLFAFAVRYAQVDVMEILD